MSYIRMYQKPRFKYETDEVDNLQKSLKEQLKIIDGVPRWTTNNNIPPMDVIEFAIFLGYEIDLEKTQKVNAEEMEIIIQQMKKQGMTDEERFEIDANFEQGEVVVNVLTGEKYIAGGKR